MIALLLEIIILISGLNHFSESQTDWIEFYPVMMDNTVAIIFIAKGKFIEQLDNSFNVAVEVKQWSHHHVPNVSSSWEVINFRCKLIIILSLIWDNNLFLSNGLTCDSHVCRVGKYIIFTVSLCLNQFFQDFFIFIGDTE